MSVSLTLLSTCAAAGLGAAAIVSLCADLFFRDRQRIQERMRQEFQAPEQRASKSPLFRNLHQLHAKTAGGQSKQRDFRAECQWWLEQSGVSWTAEQLIAAAVILGLCGVGTLYWLSGRWYLALLGITAALFPWAAVELYRRRRRGLLTIQLPEAFDQMRRSVRAGQTLMTAMQQISNDFPSPLADEFAVCCQQQQLGMSQAAALQDLARRVSIMELQMFVVAVLVQREVGGNSAELLGNLSNVVRQRFRLALRVKALTGEGRMQAFVLALLPIVAGAAIYFLNRDYAQVLLDRPSLLAGLACCEVIGVLWIRRIVHVEH